MRTSMKEQNKVHGSTKLEEKNLNVIRKEHGLNPIPEGDVALFMKNKSEFANETLDRAEKKGLTLAEVLASIETMKNIIMNELREKKVPYRGEKP